MKSMVCLAAALVMLGAKPAVASAQPGGSVAQPIVLHAARLFAVVPGTIVSPGEVLVERGRIEAADTSLANPGGAKVIDMGDMTLLPSLIDAHVQIFLPPGPPSKVMQTVDESAPQR